VNLSTEALHRFFEALEKLNAEPEGTRLPLLRRLADEFGEMLDYVAVAEKCGMPLKHIVVLVHGIRDDGDWFQVLRRCLEGLPYIRVSFGGYGYFSFFKFAFSKSKRAGALGQVLEALRDSQSQNCVLSVVCHSFGTYCVTKAALENADVRVFRLVLCGGIVPRTFPWNRVPSTLAAGRVVNECGNDDPWPIWATFLRRIFGDTGRFGFMREPVRDRWHDVDHSGFFTEEFVRRYWVPFLTRGEIVPSQVSMRQPSLLLRLVSGRIP
jgi:pimeloyl-ACP methyl ester carboxylesterase